MTDHLALWQAVERTDPSHTKPITGKSYSGTSPKPYYLVRKATETFGPVGIGWGYDIVSEQIVEGVPGEKLHMARVRVWYMWDGKRGEVEHVGGTPFSGFLASGKSFIDEDAAKKSVTDALIKALSMIGFAGDIFMGRYDDSKYVAELRAEEREAAKPAPKTAPASKPVADPIDPAESASVRDFLIGTMDYLEAAGDFDTWAKENKPTIESRLVEKDRGLVRQAWSARKHSFEQADKRNKA